jgi:hypothetical protein
MDQLSKRMAGNGKPSEMGEAVVAGGGTLQKVQTDFVTAVAVQVPRDKKDVLARVIEECSFDPEGLIYAWTARNKDGSKGKISGPSIKMAMILSREWGNCATDAIVIDETDTHWTFKGFFIDLERGSTTPRLYRQRKPAAGKGRMDKDRTEDIDYQIGQSKAVRNAVVNAMPAWLMNKALKAARGELARELTKGGKADAIAKVKRAFAKWDVTVAMLEKRLDKKSGKWTADDLADLRAVYSAIDDGQTTADDEFDLSGDAKQGLADAVNGKTKGKGKGKSSKAADEPPPPEPPAADDQPPDPPPSDEPPLPDF